MKTVIYLIRHAEVHNPRGIWYGRMEGFPLSERGLRMAKVLGEHFADHDLKAVYSSPLERAWQTAEAIAVPHGLEVTPEHDIIESETRLQGKHGDFRLFRNPLNVRFFVNPYRPTWGESYKNVGDRMVRAIERMRDKHRGGEVAAVSHMTPISVARLRIANMRRPPWRVKIPTGLASVTALEFEGKDLVRSRYETPAADA